MSNEIFSEESRLNYFKQFSQLSSKDKYLNITLLQIQHYTNTAIIFLDISKKECLKII